MSEPAIELVKIEETYFELETATIIKNEVLVDEKLEIADVEKTKCGEIFSINSGSFILICGFCGAEIENMRLFGEHLREKHPDGIFQSNFRRVEPPSDPISVSAPIIKKAELDISADEFLTDDESNHSEHNLKEEHEVSGISSFASEDDKPAKKQPTKVAGASFSCDLCGRSYRLKKSLKRHKKVACKKDISAEPTGDPDLFCRICCKQIKTRSSFNRHQRSMHKKKLKSEETETEKVDPTLFCDLCNKFFKSKFNFEYHVKRAHDKVLPLALQNDSDFLKCKFCHKQFSDFAEKTQHESAHTEERPYICLQCPSTFVQNTQLTKHLRKHSDVRNFSCEFCDQAFKTRTVLRIHMSRHTGNRPFVCEECGLTFVIETQLNYHRKRHKGQKEFCCDVCQKGFYSMFTLKEHQIGHTGEQPFSCDVCGRKFSRLRAFNKHMKLHSGVKEYVCNICGKAYAQDSGLYAHKKSHFK